MKRKLQNELITTVTELIQLFSSINKDKINVVPFEGSWTAGQLAQHMIMSNSGFADMINGPVKETERKPDQFVENIKSDFLDFTTKMESPDFVRPAKINYNKDELLYSLNAIKEQVNQAVETPDLTKTCISFEIPGIGYLTRLEAAHFILYHTQRHIHQLKKINRKLINDNVSLT